ncbi:MAG: hypothetical protein JWR19_2610 [Pedosphaera sp.]|nr:hypothetical protein [Pedosphaera sp.]
MAGAPLPAESFAAVRRHLLLDCCKWDSQIGDVCTLANFPLIMRSAVWRLLAAMTETLSAEALAAEAELLRTPELLECLGLPRSICRILQSTKRTGPTRAAARVMRFDFHLTTDGWRISEVNSDVPGGFTEASSFTQLLAAHYAGAQPAGDPVTAWCDALAQSAGEIGAIALLSAPGFMEDHQIMAYLARRLNAQGYETHLANPLQLEWRDGIASMISDPRHTPLAAIVRFYQGEWLARLPEACGWSNFFCGGRTPVGNPGSAIISESKRFPLAWDDLQTPLPAWRKLLPETRDPRDVPWETDDTWLLKSAFCNTGDTVSIRSLLPSQQWQSVAREVRRRPQDWVAQKRFQTLAVNTPAGPLYPCIGVYTINGQVAGAYARVAPRQLIDFAAIDIALLVENFL